MTTITKLSESRENWNSFIKALRFREEPAMVICVYGMIFTLAFAFSAFTYIFLHFN